MLIEASQRSRRTTHSHSQVVLVKSSLLTKEDALSSKALFESYRCDTRRVYAIERERERERERNKIFKPAGCWDSDNENLSWTRQLCDNEAKKFTTNTPHASIFLIYSNVPLLLFFDCGNGITGRP